MSQLIGIVDQAALATAPVDGRLSGAPIDVFAGVTEESNRRIGEIATALVDVRRVPAERGWRIGRPEALPRREGAL